MMFCPALAEMDGRSIAESVWNSVQQCDMDARVPCGENIVLSGGNSMFAGFADRLKAEVAKLAPPAYEITVYATDTRKHQVWKGASTLASGANFASERMITKEEFEQVGAAGVISKKNAV